MSYPIRYAHGHIVFGEHAQVAALFRIALRPYIYLPIAEQHDEFARLARWLASAEHDISLWRVNRLYPVEEYVDRTVGLLDTRHQDPRAWTAYLDSHRSAMEQMAAFRPELYCAVSLHDPRPEGFGTGLVRLVDAVRRRLEAAAGVGGARPIRTKELVTLGQVEARVRERLLASGLQARPVTTSELQWLMRRTGSLGIGEPPLDPWWRPNAIVAEGPDGEDAEIWPTETQMLRHDSCLITERARHIECETEAGVSYQSYLTIGSLVDEAPFPGPVAEFMSAPGAGLPFPVDVALHAHVIPNRDARAVVRRRIVDADVHFQEEMESTHGPLSWQSEERRGMGRELQSYLEGEGRPPLYRAHVVYGVGAPSLEEMEEYVEALRDRLSPIEVHRPLGLQALAREEFLPRPDAGALTEYADWMTVWQIAASMPTAGDNVGHEQGAYIGYTTSGGAAPVLWDPEAASRTHRAPAIMLTGTLGGGKTVAAELLAFTAACRGSLVVDLDPKGDHRLAEAAEALPEYGLAGRVEVIELAGGGASPGMLDPMRIAPAEIREDVTASYLGGLLPPSQQGRWDTEIRSAVRAAVSEGAGSSLRVLARLEQDDAPGAREAARALRVWADMGLGRLGFAQEGTPSAAISTDVHRLRRGAAIIAVRAHHLSLPDAASRSEWDEQQRISAATLQLLTVYAIDLAADPDRHSCVLVDEAWSLLSSSFGGGRNLIARLIRLGRSQNITPMIATQRTGDLGDLGDLIGTRIVFGQETQEQVRESLRMLGLDEDDEALVSRIRDYRSRATRGICLYGDEQGRRAEVQIHVPDPRLLAALGTSPEERRRTAAAAASSEVSVAS